MPPSRQEVWNASFTSGVSDRDGGLVSLKDGKWTGESTDGFSRPHVELAYDYLALGDIDRDGVDEALVVINENGGGSGQFRSLVLYDRMDDRVAEAAAIPIGDRVQVKSIRIAPGYLTAEIVRQTGPLCCPDEVVRLRFPYAGGHFGEVSETTILGKLSPAILSGSSWTPEANVSLTYQAGIFRGNAGCNNFTAPVTQLESNGVFAVGPITTTRRACSESRMLAEAAFLKRLQSSNQMWFSPDHLHFLYTVPGEGGRLDFEQRR